ncbi:MAG: hypothetical protein WBH20_05375 [Oceanisphaera sp.]|uniref:hypothetical protein n=1 Tax=Oceanisphaera sp. TaxID=1929979 RepID=UPI003C74C351
MLKFLPCIMQAQSRHSSINPLNLGTWLVSTGRLFMAALGVIPFLHLFVTRLIVTPLATTWL